jgi:Uma2 family endonuclease
MLATSKEVRFTVDEYFRMSAAGVFGSRRVELINGRVYPMHAQAHPHELTIIRLNRLLLAAYSETRFYIASQGTLRLSEHNAPDPDFHLIEAPQTTPADELPLPFLVIEVSDSTYRRDSGTKLRLYAVAGVPEYWIVNLKKKRIEVRKGPINDTGEPSDWRYATLTELSSEKTIELPKLDGRTTTAGNILPP